MLNMHMNMYKRSCSVEPREGECQIYRHSNYWEHESEIMCWALGIEDVAHDIEFVRASAYKCGSGVDFVFGTKDGKPAFGGQEAENQPNIGVYVNRLTWVDIQANSGTKAPLTMTKFKTPETNTEWLECKQDPIEGTCQFY